MQHELRIGLALTGSFCTFDKALALAAALAEKYDLTALVSETAAATDTRYGAAADLIARLEEITGRPVLRSITQAEPIGPQGLFDVLAVAPCTASTLAKIAAGVAEGTVPMAVKSQLRGGRPVVLAFGSNDGLGASARNLGELLARRDIYFAPMYQDDPEGKPRSLASDYARVEAAICAAFAGRQLQPIIGGRPE